MRQGVGALFHESGAILQGHFRLTSGRHSPTYIEKFRLLESPRHSEALCHLIADHFRPSGVDLVAAPTTGGIIVSYEVARQLGVRGIFAERADPSLCSGQALGRRFGRGFRVGLGERTLVVDDVLTTGGSIHDVLAAVRAAGGLPVGVGVLVDRSGGQDDFGLPFFACLTLTVPSYEPASCPLCARGLPLTET